jgi:Tfp pilus assembly protein PilF
LFCGTLAAPVINISAVTFKWSAKEFGMLSHSRSPFLSLRGLNLLCCSCLVFALSTIALAQSGGGVDSTGTGGTHTIRGRIYFPSGRRTDVRVKVKLQSLNSGELTVFSDSNGAFAFRGLEPGTYTVVVEAGDDYEQARESVYIEQQAGNPRLGIVPPPVARLYTVDVSLRLKQEARIKAGVISAALASVPEPAKELYLKGIESAEAGDAAKGIEQLKAAITIYPEFSIALNELGVLYLKTGKPEKAAEVLEKSVKLAPESFPPRLNFGIALLNLHRLSEAEEQLRFAVNRSNSAPTAHMYLGITLAVQRKLEEGQKELELAIASNSSEVALAHRYLAGVFLERHEFTKAADELESYLKLVPKVSDASVLQQKIRELRNKKNGATPFTDSGER